MKIRLSNRMAGPVCEQFARWLPNRAEQFRRIAERATLGLEITVEPIKARRSLEANARYWAIVSALASYVGMSKAEMHEEVLSEFAGYDLVQFRGSLRKRPHRRSHNLSRDDFSALMAIAEQWASEMGISWEEEAA